jgi:hypothetical protein
MSSIVKIVPFDEVTTKTALKISLHTTEVKSGKTTFRVSLYDSDDVCFTHKYVTLDEQEILNCGSDDKYVLDYIVKILGLTLIE